MELGLRGKKAIITGGSRGIGLHTGMLLAQEGCCIAFCARGQREIDAAIDKIGDQGSGTVVGFQADLEDGDATRNFVSRAIERSAASISWCTMPAVSTCLAMRQDGCVASRST